MNDVPRSPDLSDLTDAFAEFERRSDEASALLATHNLTHRAAARPVLIAASAAAVIAIAAGGVLLSRGTGSAPSSRQAGVGASATVTSADTTVATPTTSTPTAPTTPAPTSAEPTSSKATTSPTRAHTVRQLAAGTVDDLERQFRVVLGNTARITVTDSGYASDGSDLAGPAISGIMTTSDGARGGYYVTVYQNPRGSKADCSSDVAPGGCVISSEPDGSTLAAGQSPLEGAAGSVDRQVTLVHPDGVTLIMSSSNQSDTKGLSPKLSATPPLTTQQMTELLSSDKW